MKKREEALYPSPWGMFGLMGICLSEMPSLKIGQHCQFLPFTMHLPCARHSTEHLLTYLTLIISHYIDITFFFLEHFIDKKIETQRRKWLV